MSKKEWDTEALDEVVNNTTAFRSMGELVENMRGEDGYGQKYVPTLRPDGYPEFEEGLHAVRAEAQRLGFAVFPDDNTFAPTREEPEHAPAEPSDLGALDFEIVEQGPAELEHEEPDEYDLEL